MLHDYRVVDVFTTTPLQGNPVAVLFDAEGLDTAAMQRIAAWTNLSETTFCLKPAVPEADYSLRIFTPRSELPFAGHPTLGSAHALIEAGKIDASRDEVVQHCGAGLVPIRLSGEGAARRLSLRLPPATIHPLAVHAARLETILGSPLSGAAPQLIDVGARWIVSEVPSVEALRALAPDLAASAALEHELQATGVTVYAQAPDGTLELRSFAPSCGVAEDPVCGSGNGAVAAYRRATGQIGAEARYEAEQGRALGRAGRISLQLAGGEIFVGGPAVTTVAGQIRLP